MRSARTALGVVLVSAALALAACGGGAGAPSTSATVGTHIVIDNFMYSPMSLSVQPGARIDVTNEDGVTHTLTATGNQFNTGDIGPHQTKSFVVPTRPGTYHYICSIHQYMMGTIVVR